MIIRSNFSKVTKIMESSVTETVINATSCKDNDGDGDDNNEVDSYVSSITGTKKRTER